MAPVTSSSSKALRKSTARSSAPLKAAHTPSPYEIMAARISNRIAELAENYTFVERPQMYDTFSTITYQETGSLLPSLYKAGEALL